MNPFMSGDYDNHARFVVPTQGQQGRYRNVGFPLPTVTLPNAQPRGLSGMMTPATWASPKFMLSGLHGQFDSSATALSSDGYGSPQVPIALAAPAPSGNIITQHPDLTALAVVVAGYFLWKQSKRRA